MRVRQLQRTEGAPQAVTGEMREGAWADEAATLKQADAVPKLQVAEAGAVRI